MLSISGWLEIKTHNAQSFMQTCKQAEISLPKQDVAYLVQQQAVFVWARFLSLPFAFRYWLETIYKA